ncbi:AAA family ATPase [Sinorhizobium sp. BG8]|uniref:AAA family ATPase n=1 Tax=Sinorhizobium sp. BG8 TaxID=2613773 RepID=UPI00193E9DB2|nr:AAA family ATPase [Sinorhizobium sp. BG8]QRM55171.1 AAA family ATPase [Sinorhizobium sp. BG8]
MAIVVLTGASGAGKTTIAQAVRAARPDMPVLHFDSIGVPETARMISDFGSPEAWQYAMVLEWMRRLKVLRSGASAVLFEGQARLAFLKHAAAAVGGVAYRPILVDCDDQTRRQRLRVNRNQPELATQDMMNWALYLRKEAAEYGADILDTSGMAIDASVARVLARLDQ